MKGTIITIFALRDLEKRFDVLSGRYAEIKEMHEKLFPMLNQILSTLSAK